MVTAEMKLKDASSLEASLGFLGGSDGKESACYVRDLGSTPWSVRSPGEGNGNTCQYLGLENSTGRGAWPATVYGVTKSQIQLRD